MDKQTFFEILQSALLSFEGVQEAELIKDYGFTPELARLGVKLCSYLKPKEVLL